MSHWACASPAVPRWESWELVMAREPCSRPESLSESWGWTETVQSHTICLSTSGHKGESISTTSIDHFPSSCTLRTLDCPILKYAPVVFTYRKPDLVNNILYIKANKDVPDISNKNNNKTKYIPEGCIVFVFCQGCYYNRNWLILKSAAVTGCHSLSLVWVSRKCSATISTSNIWFSYINHTLLKRQSRRFLCRSSRKEIVTQ